MKKRIVRLCGVGLVLMLLAGLLVSAVPVSAGTLTWTTQAVPSELTGQLAFNEDASFLKEAGNGDLFCVDTEAVGGAHPITGVADVANRVYKSVDGGTSWTPSAPLLVGGVAINNVVDLEVSPNYILDSTVFVLVNSLAGPVTPQVLISTNGGASFAQLGNLALAAHTGTSLSVSPTYNNGVGEVMVGTQVAADSAASADSTLVYGDVYIWGRLGVLTWQAQQVHNEAPAVAQDGNFAEPGGGDGLDESFLVTYVNQNGVVHAGVGNGALIVVDTVTTGGGAVAWNFQGTGAADTGIRDIINVAIAAGPLGADSAAGVLTITGAATGNIYGTWTQATATYADGVGGGDIMDVAYSPYNPIDSTILAISATGGAAAAVGGTFMHSKVGNQAWDLTVGAAPGPVALTDGNPAGAVLIREPLSGVAPAIVSAAIALPTDYNSSVGALRTAYAALRSGSAFDRIYRVVTGDSLGIATAKMTPSAILADAEMTSLVFAGASASGVLYAGAASVVGFLTSQVYMATGPGSLLPLWSAALVPPIGGGAAATQLTYVALDQATFAATNRVYAGTAGAGAANDDSGVSVSNDGGTTFAGAGLIDTTLNTVQDFQAVSATELFMCTEDGGVSTSGNDSVWKTEDGATWYRKMIILLTGNTGILRPSPGYATDMTIYLGDTGSGAAGNIRLSYDGGTLWELRSVTTIGALADLAVKDQYTVFAAGAGAAVDSTTVGGWGWQPFGATPIVGAGALNDIEVDPTSGDILVGDAAGVIFISQNNNVSYTALAAGVTVGGGVGVGPAIVSFGPDYANTGVVYAADTGSAIGVDLIWNTADDVGVKGIWAYTIGTSTAWGLLSLDWTGPVLAPRDILVSPDGIVYGSDFVAAAPAATGGIVRVINPLNPFTVTTERVTSSGVGVGDGLTVGATLSGLTMAEGSNILWGINVATMRTFTDTLSDVFPAGVTPAEGAVVDNTQASVTWTYEAVTGAQFYSVRFDTRADFFSGLAQVASAPIFNPVSVAAAPIVDANGVAINGQTVYWQVRVTAPLFSLWSPTYTFNTELVVAAVNSPVIRGPFEGGTNYGGWDASINPSFQWGSIAGATGYEFILATDVDLTDRIVDATGANALGNVLAYTLTPAVYTLDYNTTYYWTVRAIGAGTNNTWADVVAFTTVGAAGSGEEAPPTPTTPIVITQVPAPTITIPAAPAATTITFQPPDEVTEEISPAYIWVIIVIGAVLVIAVIILIVRTRRSV